MAASTRMRRQTMKQQARRSTGRTMTPTARIRSGSGEPQRRGGMKRSFLVFLGVCLNQQQLVTSQNPDVNQRTIACFDSEVPLVGYDRIQDIVNDQADEFARIESGEAPRPPYVFRLCPNTDFDTANMAITVLLDGIIFSCGPNLASTDNCIFTGGNQQVRFEDGTVEGYNVATASFVGVTFTGFGASSVKAFASAGTTAMFIDCIWRDFNSNNLLKLGVETGAPMSERMRVEVSGGSLIQNGSGGTFFSNDAGTLIFDDVRFENIMAISAIASSTGGVTMLDRVSFDGGDMDSFAFASGGAAHTVINTTVSGLTGINDVFSVRGNGTTLTMFNTDIRDNLLQEASAFTGVRALDNATATITRSSFTGNTGVSFGYLSRNSANMTLVDVDILSNTGIMGALTATTYVDNDAQITLRHVTFTGNFVFTAHVFALFSGSADVRMSCFNSGGGDTILFFSENSVYTDVDNFVSTEMASTTCSDARDGRLAQENENSGCFDNQDDRPCSIGCERFGRASECIATMAPTSTPSAAPTLIPSALSTISPAPTLIPSALSFESTISPTPSNDNGSGNGNGNGGGNGGPTLFPTISSAPTISPQPTRDPASGTGPSIPTVGGPASAPSLFTNPAYSPFFMNPAVAPYFSDPAVSPTVDAPAFTPAFAPALDNPAFAPAFIPSIFSTPTCDPALHSPTVDPASRPSFGQTKKPTSYYSPSVDGTNRSRKGKRGKSKSNSKSKSEGKGGKGYKKGMKGMKGMRPGASTWTHHHEDDSAPEDNQGQDPNHHHPHQYNHHPNQHHHHHPHQHHQAEQLHQDPNQHILHPIKQFLEPHAQQFQPPIQQYPPNQQNQDPDYHDPHGDISQPHQHGETQYVRDYVERRFEWGTDHAWNTHTQADETFSAYQPHQAATSNGKVRHPRKGRIRHRRELKAVREELEEAAAHLKEAELENEEGKAAHEAPQDEEVKIRREAQGDRSNEKDGGQLETNTL